MFLKPRILQAAWSFICSLIRMRYTKAEISSDGGDSAEQLITAMREKAGRYGMGDPALIVR
jgi:hypothetical protein